MASLNLSFFLLFPSRSLRLRGSIKRALSQLKLTILLISYIFIVTFYCGQR